MLVCLCLLHFSLLAFFCVCLYVPLCLSDFAYVLACVCLCFCFLCLVSACFCFWLHLVFSTCSLDFALYSLTFPHVFDCFCLCFRLPLPCVRLLFFRLLFPTCSLNCAFELDRSCLCLRLLFYIILAQLCLHVRLLLPFPRFLLPFDVGSGFCFAFICWLCNCEHSRLPTARLDICKRVRLHV